MYVARKERERETYKCVCVYFAIAARPEKEKNPSMKLHDEFLSFSGLAARAVRLK